ncbi:cyclic lactone autoinducer peptide [Lacrimispora sp.]|uniref:cyclic lactone autoinducer peptide n=1 Tax=Lacrimispora sp. TaxID=2719234 RepID=UPI002FDAB422
MKQLLNSLRAKVSMVKVMNACALLIAAYTINVTCVWIQHQPEVPEEAKMLRKF